MTDTIKARDGYRVHKAHNIETGETGWLVWDGNRKLFVAQRVSREDYEDECENNEGVRLLEVFTTVKGNQWIYWTDEEDGEDRITLIRKAGEKESRP